MRIDIVNGISNQVGFLSLVWSSFMVLFSIVSASLIVSYWKDNKEKTKQSKEK